MNFRTLILFVIAPLFLVACGSKDHGHDHSHGADGKEWKEMDSFHMVMAEAFHPYKDSANLVPAKQNASDLATSAKEWRDSEIPDGVDAAKVKPKLDELVRLSDEFGKQVSSSTDDQIASSLTILHDLFHDLQNEFYAASAEHEHGDDHHH